MLPKYLEVLRNALAWGHDETIALQAENIAVLAEDMPWLAGLVELLENQQYAAAARWLQTYEKQHSAIVPHRDLEIDALKFELRALEKEAVALTAQKEEYEQLVDEFTALYYVHCGELMAEILRVQLELAKKAPAQESQAQQAFDDFEQARQQAKKPPPELSSAQRDDMKKMYRQACQRCHPDKLADKDKARGTKQFQELQAAYKNHDLDRVRAIWSALQADTYIDAADALQEKTALGQKIAAHRQQIALLKKEIAALLADDTMQEIMAIDDWSAYFAALKKELQNKLHQLQAQQDG